MRLEARPSIDVGGREFFTDVRHQKAAIQSIFQSLCRKGPWNLEVAMAGTMMERRRENTPPLKIDNCSHQTWRPVAPCHDRVMPCEVWSRSGEFPSGSAIHYSPALAKSVPDHRSISELVWRTQHRLGVWASKSFSNGEVLKAWNRPVLRKEPDRQRNEKHQTECTPHHYSIKRRNVPQRMLCRPIMSVFLRYYL